MCVRKLATCLVVLVVALGRRGAAQGGNIPIEETTPLTISGFAVGLDRLTALSLGLDNIRDMVAFPKTTSASDLMCEAPSPVAPEQLAEVHIRTVVPPKKP